MNSIQSFLTDSAVKSGVVLGLALLVASLLRARHASLKHLALTCAFAVCLVMPLAQAVVRPRPILAPILVTEARDLSPTPAVGQPRAVAPTQHASQAGRSLPITGIWLAGFASCLLYWAFGRVRASLIYRSSSPFESSGFIDGVRVARGLHPATAVTWGVLRSAILLPASSQEWSPREVRSALDHELAHVRRRDDLAHTIGWLAASLNWFNPLFWIALRSQRLAAEIAADEIVGASRTVPADYAQDLLSIAARTSPSQPIPSFGVTMLNSSNIEYRIRVILTGRAPSRIGTLALGTLLATATLAVAALGPLRSQGPADSTARSGLEGIGRLSSQELALGHSSRIDRDRPELIFFGDFECPSCRKIAPVVTQVRNSGYGTAFFHFPLKYHAHARLAAQAMVAASKQGAEWKAYDALFAMPLTDQSIRTLGGKLGIDQGRFAADLDSEATKQRVQDSFDLCQRLKLNHVPTFFKLGPDGRAAELDSNGVRALARTAANG